MTRRNFTGLCASVVVSLNCFARGYGVESQSLFADGNTWLWYALGVIWALIAFDFLVND